MCCYRAAHQSIVIDEAYTYNHFVDGTWASLYFPRDANYHILFSILAKLSVGAFGLSEFSLRLPTLIAGFFLILGVFRVLETGASRKVRWIALVALSLQPLLLDFSVAARGYGLGLALFVYALHFSMRRRFVMAGTLAGLAIAANLTMAFPVLGLMCAAALVERRGVPIVKLTGPAAILGAIFWFGALRGVIEGSYRIGYPTIRESLYSIVFPSTTDHAGLFRIEHRTAVTAEMIVILSIAAFIAIVSARDFLRKAKEKSIPGLTLTATALGLVAAHYLFRLPYPVDRTGVYLVLLFGLAWAIAADEVKNRWSRRINLTLACAAILQFALAFETQYFLIWKFDMRTATVARLVKKACEGKPDGSVTVSAAWVHQSALEFYRRDLHITALRPVEYHDPAPLAGFDFYVLNEPDANAVDQAGLRRLYSDRESGIVLAESKR